MDLSNFLIITQLDKEAQKHQILGDSWRCCESLQSVTRSFQHEGLSALSDLTHIIIPESFQVELVFHIKNPDASCIPEVSVLPNWLN